MKSMSSLIRSYIGVLVAALMQGVGFRPRTLPRPVVKTKTFDPPGTADGGSLLANLEVQINGNNLDLRGEFGEAPANPKACAEIATQFADETHCDVFKATDEAFAQSIAFWATPRKECLNGKGSDCVPFVDWIKAWTEIKG